MKPFNKIKQLANTAFVRPDKSGILSEDLQRAELKIELISKTCESTIKKITGCLQGKEFHTVDKNNKRFHKVPEVILGLDLTENAKSLLSIEDHRSVLGEVLCEAGKIEMTLGNELIKFGDKVETTILQPLQRLMNHDLPNIFKSKRTLTKLMADLDAAKTKLNQANRHSMSSNSTIKMDNIKDECDDIQLKVEMCRDNLAAEMYQLIARESEISQYIVNFIILQKDYHTAISETLLELLPEAQSALNNSVRKPVFGFDLVEHLNSTQRIIAYPIELCVCGLLTFAMEEEGLFRIAGSSSKVKKLKSAIDAGFADLQSLTEINDPHVVANALKCYLRELPQPLLTFELYNDWISAISITDQQEKIQSLWQVVQNLPKQNFDNLRYLVKFLTELTKRKEINKMTQANIAIVFGPNVMWSPRTNSDDILDGLNMTMTHLYSSVLDQLISYSDYFFPEEIEYFITYKKFSDIEAPNKTVANGTIAGSTDELTNENDVQIKRTQSNSSLDENSPPDNSPRPVIRRKNKPAPVPPSPKTPQLTNLVKTNSFESKVKIPEVIQSQNDTPIKFNKRDGIAGFPPSPSQMDNRKSYMGTPPKPPPPKPTTSPFKHNSSFKANRDALSSDNNLIQGLSPGTNIYQSLPRLKSNKNNNNIVKALPQNSPLPPPPAPPNQSSSIAIKEQQQKIQQSSEQQQQQTKISQPPLDTKIGFENIEIEYRRESFESTPNKEIIPNSTDTIKNVIENFENQQQQHQIPSTTVTRPVPAPRSSLLQQLKDKDSHQQIPVIKERPSISAKPRDISKKSQNTGDNRVVAEIVSAHERKSSGGSSGGDSDNLEMPSLHSAYLANQRSDSVDENSLEKAKNQNRPPRPQPPPPPKTVTQSTDL